MLPVRSDLTGGAVEAHTSGNVPFSTWRHVAATWDGTGNATGIHIYLDGVEQSYASAQNGSGSKNDAANDLVVGSSHTDGTIAFDGALDDARLCRRVLSPSEINQIFLGG